MKRSLACVPALLFAHACQSSQENEQPDRCVAPDSEPAFLIAPFATCSGGTIVEVPLPFLPGQKIGTSQGGCQSRKDLSCFNSETGEPICSHWAGGSMQYAADLSLPGSTDRGLPVAALKAGVAEVFRDCPDNPRGLRTKCGGGWGNHVLLCSSGECYRYAHLRDVFIESGERVSLGQVIGTLGSSGQSDGPHLHSQRELENSTPWSQPLKFASIKIDEKTGGCRDCMTSQNSDLFDSIRTAGRGALGKHKQYMWHPSDYVECQDEDGNDSFVCKDDKLRKMTYYVEELTGGAYGHAMIVYDALGGARRPVVVSGSFLDHVEVGWGRKREIDQSYGAPLNEAYAWRSGRRQDFTYGLLEESGQVIKWRLYPARINDGMSVGPGLRAPSSPGGEHWWDGRVSYLFVDAWNRTSKSHSGSTLSPSGFLGFPKNPSNADDEPAGVHYWTGLSENTRYLVQDFDGGEVGWNVIVYDTGNSEYRNEHQTFNQAFNIRGPIWRYFREHDGMNRFGPPVSDEIVDDGDPRKSSQRFRHGTLYLFQGVVSEAPNSCPVSGLGSMSCPTRHEVSCVSRPEGLQVTIHGPITDALVSGPVSNATAIQYGANHPPGPSPWVIPYPPGVSRPSVPWGGDDAVHIFLLPPDTNQFNFAVTNGSTASWFDIDTTGPQLWRATGNCTITHPSGGGGYFVRF